MNRLRKLPQKVVNDYQLVASLKMENPKLIDEINSKETKKLELEENEMIKRRRFRWRIKTLPEPCHHVVMIELLY